MEIGIPVEDATDRQLLVAVLQRVARIELLVEGVVLQMADVNASLVSLVAAVDEVGVEFGALNTSLQTALADRAAAQEALNVALANDAADAAEIARLQALLDAANGVVDGVAAQIDAQTARLNQLGTPVVPVDAPVVAPVVEGGSQV